MHYLSYVQQSYSCTNSLQKSIAAFLVSQKRILIADNKLEAFKQFILDNIDLLNFNNKRCTPVSASWYSSNGKDYQLHMDMQIISFNLYAATSNY